MNAKQLRLAALDRVKSEKEFMEGIEAEDALRAERRKRRVGSAFGKLLKKKGFVNERQALAHYIESLPDVKAD